MAKRGLPAWVLGMGLALLLGGSLVPAAAAGLDAAEGDDGVASAASAASGSQGYVQAAEPVAAAQEEAAAGTDAGAAGRPASGPSAAEGARATPLDQRVLALSEQLRCLVCQNQTIADSHVQLAMDLKAEVRRQLAAGKSDADVIDFMTARYGDFVLYRPPFKASTWVLWIGPFLLLAGGLVILLRALRRQASVPQDEEIEA